MSRLKAIWHILRSRPLLVITANKKYNDFTKNKDDGHVMFNCMTLTMIKFYERYTEGKTFESFAKRFKKLLIKDYRRWKDRGIFENEYEAITKRKWGDIATKSSEESMKMIVGDHDGRWIVKEKNYDHNKNETRRNGIR